MLLALQLLTNRHRVRLGLKSKNLMAGETFLLEIFTLVPHSLLGKLGETTWGERVRSLWKKKAVIKRVRWSLVLIQLVKSTIIERKQCGAEKVVAFTVTASDHTHIHQGLKVVVY